MAEDPTTNNPPVRTQTPSTKAGGSAGSDSQASIPLPVGKDAERARRDSASTHEAAPKQADASKATDNKGSGNKGSDNRSSDHRGSDHRGSDNRGPDNRGPDSRGPDSRGSDNRATDKSARNAPRSSVEPEQDAGEGHKGPRVDATRVASDKRSSSEDTSSSKTVAAALPKPQSGQAQEQASKKPHAADNSGKERSTTEKAADSSRTGKPSEVKPTRTLDQGGKE